MKVSKNETLYNEYLHYKFNAMTEKGKAEEYTKMWERYQNKQSKDHWCRAAQAVHNYHKKGKIKTISVDDTCYEHGIMTQFIDRHSKK